MSISGLAELRVKTKGQAEVVEWNGWNSDPLCGPDDAVCIGTTGGLLGAVRRRDVCLLVCTIVPKNASLRSCYWIRKGTFLLYLCTCIILYVCVCVCVRVGLKWEVPRSILRHVVLCLSLWNPPWVAVVLFNACYYSSLLF